MIFEESRRKIPQRRFAYACFGVTGVFALGAMQWLMSSLVEHHPWMGLVFWSIVGLGIAWSGYVLGVREEQLEEESLLDPLTGLTNRRYALVRIDQELARSRRYGAPLALLTIDVDKLKTINDLHGHLAGDAALRWVSECLAKQSRSTDVPSRFAGDEFVVLAPSTNKEQAQDLAERIRKAIAATPVTCARDVIEVSVSIGVVGLVPPVTSTTESLLRRADRQMYAAKSRGRNRVESGTTPVTVPTVVETPPLVASGVPHLLVDEAPIIAAQRENVVQLFDLPPSDLHPCEPQTASLRAQSNADCSSSVATSPTHQ